MMRRRLSVAKKLMFGLFCSALFFAVLEGSLRLVGVRASSETEDPYLGFSGYLPLFTRSVADDGTTEYVTADSKRRWFNPQRFPAEKSPHTCRIFCLGGSTTYGHPYHDATSFSGWLRAYLPEIDPAKNWEVINCGGISYASYRVAALMEELLEYQPDVFIIYTGHNEFLEARTYDQLLETPSVILKLGGILSQTSTYSLVSRLMRSAGIVGEDQAGQGGSAQLSTEVNTLLDSSIGPAAYHRDDEQRRQIAAHFAFNLRRMVELARRHGARIILVTPACSLGDCSPFKSENSAELTGARLQEWQSAFERATELSAAESYATALVYVNRVLELDDRHAGSYYLRGRILSAMHDYPAALRDFERARDEDVCTLRAPQEMIDLVRTISAELQVPLVDFAAWVQENSPDGIPGDALFLDHVHGTIEAYRELAGMLIDALYEMGLVGDDRWRDNSQLQEVNARVLASVDTTEHGIALRNISKVYSWAGKKDDADRVALRALELAPDDADTVYQAANAYVRQGHVDEALRLYRRVAELDPKSAPSVHASLGYAYGVKGEVDKMIEHYQQALALNPSYYDIHYNLATVYESQQKLEQAAEHYRQAIVGNPHHFQAQYRLGLIHAQQQNWPLARRQFEEAIRIDPTAVEPHVGLGNVQATLGEREAARQQYEWVLKRQPDHAEALQGLQRLEGSGLRP